MRRALKILRLPVDDSERSNGLACPACKATMELHQPDQQRPERMLGICQDCHAWTLIGVGVDGQVKLTALSAS